MGLEQLKPYLGRIAGLFKNNRLFFSLTWIFVNLIFIGTAAADVNQGEQIALGCFSCHGVNGASQGPATPVIAGLSKNYLIGAMLSYKYTDDLEKAQDIIENNKDLEDVRIHKRFSAIMQRVAKAYNLAEIKQLAQYFSGKKFVKHQQEFDRESAEQGKKLHKKYCEKCHEDWGTSTEDDVGLLAGQWQLYLNFTLEDFTSGDREMHKKMKKKLEKMLDQKGDESLKHLINFYSSQN